MQNLYNSAFLTNIAVTNRSITNKIIIMSQNKQSVVKMSNYRWVMCAMLFFATTINYLDRQVLSLTYNDFIAPEFHWDDATYGNITGWFSLLYACAMLFVGRFVDKFGTKWGYIWAIGVWSLGACAHAVCGVADSYEF